MHARLVGHGIEVIGIVDHDQYIESIYFFDPNGFRLELTVEVASKNTVAAYALGAHQQLVNWNEEKQRRRAKEAV